MTVAFFFFDAPETSDIYTLSLHDALPISCARPGPDGLARHHDPGDRRIVRRRNACGSHLWWDADRKSTRLNSSHRCISYAVFCLKKKIAKNRIRLSELTHAS